MPLHLFSFSKYTRMIKMHICSHSHCQYYGTSFSSKHSQTIIGVPLLLTPAFHVYVDGAWIQSEREKYICAEACMHTYTSPDSFKIKNA